MKAVLLSIRPKWCDLIASGKKTVEVRKTRPMLETPFKCYIYRTRGGGVIGEFVCDQIFEIETDYEVHNELPGSPVESWLTWDSAPDEYETTEDIEKATCLTIDEIGRYMGAAECCYCWHISELSVYEKPKSLCDFHKCGALSIENLDEQLCQYCAQTDYGEKKSSATPTGYWSCEGAWCDSAYEDYLEENFALTRPPQSWCYVDNPGDE